RGRATLGLDVGTGARATPEQPAGDGAHGQAEDAEQEGQQIHAVETVTHRRHHDAAAPSHGRSRSWAPTRGAPAPTGRPCRGSDVTAARTPDTGCTRCPSPVAWCTPRESGNGRAERKVPNLRPSNLIRVMPAQGGLTRESPDSSRPVSARDVRTP